MIWESLWTHCAVFLRLQNNPHYEQGGKSVMTLLPTVCHKYDSHLQLWLQLVPLTNNIVVPALSQRLSWALWLRPWCWPVPTPFLCNRGNWRPEGERACLKSHRSWVREPGLEPESLRSPGFTVTLVIIWAFPVPQIPIHSGRILCFSAWLSIPVSSLSPYGIIKPGSSVECPEENDHMSAYPSRSSW